MDNRHGFTIDLTLETFDDLIDKSYSIRTEDITDSPRSLTSYTPDPSLLHVHTQSIYPIQLR